MPTTKDIPALEDVSPEFKRLSELHNELVARANAIDIEVRGLYAAIGSEQPTDRHGDRVTALLRGVDYSPPPPIKDRMAELTAERRAVDTAIRELSGALILERQRASRTVVAGFDGERRALAAEFFSHIAAAAKAHAAYGEMKLRFHRAGVDPVGFTDFGIELFGDPGHRNGEVGVAMRAAARQGYIKTADIPKVYQ